MFHCWFSMQRGYTLDKPESRTEVPLVAQRSLSPSAICIVRALMHSTLLWCSCHCPDVVVAELAALVKTQVSPNDLPQFFWEHLRKDIEHLSVVTQKGFEETVTIIHLVLCGILKRTPPACKNHCQCNKLIANALIFFAVVITKSSLNDRDARKKWEEEFSKQYIEPIILRDVDAQIRKVMSSVDKDYHQGDYE